MQEYIESELNVREASTFSAEPLSSWTDYEIHADMIKGLLVYRNWPSTINVDL